MNIGKFVCISALVGGFSLVSVAGCSDPDGGERWPLGADAVDGGERDVAADASDGRSDVAPRTELNGGRAEVGLDGGSPTDGGRTDTGPEGPWHGDFCAEFEASSSTPRVDVHRDEAADWAFAVPDEASVERVDSAETAGDASSAAAITLRDDQVAGFVLTRPATEAEDTAFDARPGDPSDWGWDVRGGVNSGIDEPFWSRWTIEVDTCTPLPALRNELLGDVGNLGDLSGLSDNGSEICGKFRFHIRTVYREASSVETEDDQILIVGALANRDSIDSLSATSKSWQWLAGPGTVVPSSARLERRCEIWEARQTRPFDLLWVVDSAIEASRRESLVEFAEKLPEDLERYWRDVRWGVTTMQPAREGRLVDPPAWTRDGSEFVDTFQRVASRNGTSDQQGLQTGRRAIERLTSTDGDRGIRQKDWAVVYVTDGPVANESLSDEVQSFAEEHSDRFLALLPTAESSEFDCDTAPPGNYEAYLRDEASHFIPCRGNPAYLVASQLVEASQGPDFEPREPRRLGTREVDPVPFSIRAHVGGETYEYSAEEGFVLEGADLLFRGEARPDWPADPEQERAAATYYVWEE
jgi:hypothetical protein